MRSSWARRSAKDEMRFRGVEEDEGSLKSDQDDGMIPAKPNEGGKRQHWKLMRRNGVRRKGRTLGERRDEGSEVVRLLERTVDDQLESVDVVQDRLE